MSRRLFILIDEGGTTSSGGDTGTTYTIGQSALGGIVFYITNGGLHGLVGAVADAGGQPWGCSGTAMGANARGWTIGTGQLNTTTIVNGCATDWIPAKLCNDYSYGGYNDWYLPSHDELTQLIAQKSYFSSWSYTYYWSSTEIGTTTAACITYSNGYWYDGVQGAAMEKIYSNGCRAVRSF